MKIILLFLLTLSIPLDANYYLIHRGVYHEGAANGIAISFVDIILIALYFLWALEGNERRQQHQSAFWPKGTIPALGLIITGSLSMYNAPVKKLVLYELLLLCKMYFLFFYIGKNIRNQNEFRVIVSALLLGVALQSILSFVQLYTGTMYSLKYLFSSGYKELWQEVSRTEGTFRASAPLAAFLAILLPVALGDSILLSKGYHKVYPFLCFLMGFIALVLSLNRGGWVSFTISFTTMVYLLLKRRVLNIGKLFAVTLAVALIIVILFGVITSRIEDQAAKKSADSRIPLLNTAFELIYDHPIIGNGLNNYYRMIVNREHNYWNYLVHNTYLIFWAETGSIGLFFFLWFLIVIIRSGLRTSNKVNSFASVLSMCLSVGLIGHSFHMSVDIFNGFNFMYFFWFISGVIISLERFAQTGRAVEDQAQEIPKPAHVLPHIATGRG